MTPAKRKAPKPKPGEKVRMPKLPGTPDVKVAKVLRATKAPDCWEVKLNTGHTVIVQRVGDELRPGPI